MAQEPEAESRKLRSEELLRADSVPINAHLPVIETGPEARLRSREETAERAMCLLVAALKGEGLEQPIVEGIVAHYGLDAEFSPKEAEFVTDPAPSQHARTQFCWGYEAAWVLLWALGFVEGLGKPSGICDVPFAVSVLKERSRDELIADAQIRPARDLLDQADLIYRYHWAVRDARINDKPMPSNLNPDVIVERHRALNWLVGYMDQSWDEVTTDT